MLEALLHVPVKILLSIAGALFTLNFATFVTKHFPQEGEKPIIAEEMLRCDRSAHFGDAVALHELEAERARLMALRGLLSDSSVDRELDELAVRIERLDRDRQHIHRHRYRHRIIIN